ncbi:Amidohydrolase family protein [Frankia canadensis]|uniref:Amidohydrolase family protein n=1 Tax=Frankia canadensis TaxID=1836972 RepID=A0A2I2KI13_9ACTN|nr:amidohydrolase family protein [Frankia canadensis]SNQ45294.1 Amidohydrolase family protein [Frankia canadensis]SOU52584.1 Amidohydrolase family protein [Frankia canadensis]
MLDVPKIISVDDHVVEPPGVWQDRLPARYREVGPRLVRTFGRPEPGKHGYRVVDDPDAPDAVWVDQWEYEDVRKVIPVGEAQVGPLRDRYYRDLATYDEMAPGVHTQSARLADMDLNHTEAAICFPSVSRFCGQTFLEAHDKELALLCVQAYNDWMIDEWSAGDGYGRLIPLTLIPLWDIKLSVDEVHRCAAKGAHAVAFSECPPYLGLPSIHSGYWNPLWQACEETDTVVNMHIGSSSTWPRTGPDSPGLVPKSLSFQNCQVAFTDWLASGLFEIFPTLKIALTEGQVGWIPFIAGRLDNEWELGDLFEENIRTRLPKAPSHYIEGHVYGCVFDDVAGLRMRDQIGMGQIMFETDYPHGDTSFPHSKKMAEKLVTGAGLSQDEIYQLIRGNAIEVYGLHRWGITR